MFRLIGEAMVFQAGLQTHPTRLKRKISSDSTHFVPGETDEEAAIVCAAFGADEISVWSK